MTEIRDAAWLRANLISGKRIRALADTVIHYMQITNVTTLTLGVRLAMDAPVMGAKPTVATHQVEQFCTEMERRGFTVNPWVDTTHEAITITLPPE